MTNELIDLMKEFRVEVRILGVGDDSSPESNALADMLTEIHRLRSELAALELPEWVIRGSFDHDQDKWEASVYGEWDTDRVEFGRDQTGVGPDLMSAIRDAVSGNTP